LTATSGDVLITGALPTYTTSFKSCSVGVAETAQHKAITHGGAIYLQVESGAHDKFWLGSAVYTNDASVDNVARFGQSLFIDGDDLMLCVPENTSEKIGYLLKSVERTDRFLENLQGYDHYENANGTGDAAFTIPLYYMYSHQYYCVYNVDNPVYPYAPSNNVRAYRSGHDNAGCGFYYWPCFSLKYAIYASMRRHNTHNYTKHNNIDNQDYNLYYDLDHNYNNYGHFVYKIGIKTGYLMNDSYTSWVYGNRIELQNSWPPGPSTGVGQYGEPGLTTPYTSPQVKSDFSIMLDKYLQCNNGSYEFRMLNFLVNPGSAYVIQAIPPASPLSGN
ncbi:MAG: hypothetical protein EZS28_051295, partial [Streblomastix strix]